MSCALRKLLPNLTRARVRGSSTRGSRPVALLEREAFSPTDSGTLTYLTTDHLGTPVLATDDAGLEVWSGGFEPFGQDYAGAEAAGIFLRFPGQWNSDTWQQTRPEGGIYYNVHRWYGPGTGRYGRSDPLGLVRSRRDLFGYASAAPTTGVDKLGLVTCFAISWANGDSALTKNLTFGVHAALFFSGGCEGGGCQSPGAKLYDPAGSYVPSDGSDGGTNREFNIQSVGILDYFDFHCDAGDSSIEVYCFKTTCCEEQQIDENIARIGGGQPGTCAIDTGSAAQGIGPFGELKGTLSPKLLSKRLNRALRRHHGRAARSVVNCPVLLN